MLCRKCRSWYKRQPAGAGRLPCHCEEAVRPTKQSFRKKIASPKRRARNDTRVNDARCCVKKLTIFIGADHRGFMFKEKIIAALRLLGHEVVDVGTYKLNPPCDYPAISFAVGKDVVAHKNSRGILVCLTGIGHSMAANKVPGVYAALCYSKEAAELSRRHNNANVLVLGSNFVSENTMMDIINVWLQTPFDGGRHLRRIKQIAAFEKEMYKKAQTKKRKT
ncbi:MAG: ribose 5-phosphate isomerase B [Candidatus Omnitrophica bacterium]|nr:ribose 5-phosphate isomerase B [Candidatus Omnitrophota bacterium]